MSGRYLAVLERLAAKSRRLMSKDSPTTGASSAGLSSAEPTGSGTLTAPSISSESTGGESKESTSQFSHPLLGAFEMVIDYLIGCKLDADEAPWSDDTRRRRQQLHRMLLDLQEEQNDLHMDLYHEWLEANHPNPVS